MLATGELARRAVRDLVGAGIAYVEHRLTLSQYLELGRELGEVVGTERIALRAGAHAYVAKPGPVPLHTDQPEVQTIGWYCEQQDDADGASVLFDTRPFVDALDVQLRHVLYNVELMTPPLAGGPATMRWPVLRKMHVGDAVFCSPWLRPALPSSEHVSTLDAFRQLLSAAIDGGIREHRLAPGQCIFIDNRRVLHGRRRIGGRSSRVLHRLWLRSDYSPRIMHRP